MSVASQSVVERAERTVSFGPVSCDECYSLDSDDRPEEAEFWPAEPICYINADASPAVDFWNLTVCEHHVPEELPAEATHKIRFDIHKKEDHHHGHAYGREVIDGVEL